MMVLFLSSCMFQLRPVPDNYPAKLKTRSGLGDFAVILTLAFTAARGGYAVARIRHYEEIGRG